MTDQTPQNDETVASRWRKRPVVIDAAEFTITNGAAVAEWCGGELITDPIGRPAFLDIFTLEGTMHATLGDFIIKGVQGEFYSCKPSIFDATYEPAEAALPARSPK